MDMKTGEIHEDICSTEAVGLDLKMISHEEASAMKSYSPKERPVELELRRYMSRKGHVSPLLQSSLMEGFRAGYLAAESNWGSINGEDKE